MAKKVKSITQDRYIILYLLPALTVLLLLVFVPLVTNIVKSLTAANRFPVFDNYKKLFNDKIFLSDLKNTFKWLLFTLPAEMFFGLAIAILMNMKLKGKKIFRTMFIIPWVIPAMVVCIIWKWMYNSDYGILNHVLYSLKLIPQYQLWVASPKQVLPSIAAVYVWKISPFVMMMYLSGLQSISSDIYEAAMLDGAGPLTQAFRITIPLLFPVMRSVILVSTIWSLNSFVYVYSISGGGPARASELVQIFVYKIGIQEFRFEYSATASIIFLLIVMAIALMSIYFSEKTEEEMT